MACVSLPATKAEDRVAAGIAPGGGLEVVLPSGATTVVESGEVEVAGRVDVGE